mgnify:FL=1|jgi:hypothetical protein
MAGYTLSALEADIRSYTEVSSSVFTGALLGRFIENSEWRILRDVPIDAYRKVLEGNLVTDDNTINVPAKTLFVRGIEVFDSTSASTGKGEWLLRRDQTFLSEYVDRLTGEEAQDVTGKPKYYSMFGGATGVSSTTSGGIYVAPTPDTTYMYRIYINLMPTTLVTNTSGTYISQYFPNGLLYGCLVEAYGFLKGPMDMLTLYENKYKQEVQKFAGEQVGRRRRDDYTDGTIRIPVESPPQ